MTRRAKQAHDGIIPTTMTLQADPKNGLPQVLDPAKVSDLLGKKIATFAAQLADMQAQLETAKQE
ncbi:hypothetical protein [Bradyrhizobium sp. AZCC 2230]|uniref:hypothetical protein n=1 Tax=Bradyrhizobium sp. AZCC 2230 TaxID=3117021 RepID=UPI002FF19827